MSATQLSCGIFSRAQIILLDSTKHVLDNVSSAGSPVVQKRLYGWIIQPYAVHLRPTRKIVSLIILTSLCVSLQLAPRPPNVEFTSLIVFLVGAVFGASFGATLAILVMLINGFFSPWGFAGLMLPFQIAGMAITGIGGGLYRRTRGGLYDGRSHVEVAVLGAFFTLVFDFITNFGVAVSYMLTGTPILIAVISTIISGALFSLVHVVSNFFVFGIVFVPVTNTLQELLGGEKVWRKGLIPT